MWGEGTPNKKKSRELRKCDEMHVEFQSKTAIALI